MRHESLGRWRTAEDAAEAHDRAFRHRFPDRPAPNFPTKRLAPWSPADCRRVARERSKADHASSRYLGVFVVPSKPARPWEAVLGPRGRRLRLGAWPSERLAALAHDRAARFYLGAAARLNFPGDTTPPASAEALRAEARRSFKTTCASAFVGVSWSRVARRWTADIMHARTRHRLGTFDSEVEAARAYDAAARALRGPAVEANFPAGRGVAARPGVRARATVRAPTARSPAPA